MDFKFLSELGEIDFTNVNFTTHEQNSVVSDSVYSKFTFPFEMFVDDDFLKNYGDYLSNEGSGLANKINGFFLFEDKTQEAILFIQTIQGKKIFGQIDFGLEEMPNFSKKLSELPLEKFKVDDIYSFARSICTRKWPETNYNFPRIYTKKYSPDTEMWKAFDGYYNDLTRDGSEMRRNYITEEGSIYNVNIIHPCPHPLYLLRVGFESAGYRLEGDILQESLLQNQWVFSGVQYFSNRLKKKYGVVKTSYDYDEKIFVSSAFYSSETTIEKSGAYKLILEYSLYTMKGMLINVLEVKINGVLIFQIPPGKTEIIDKIILDFNAPWDNSVITVKAVSQSSRQPSYDVYKYEIVGDRIEAVYQNEESNVVVNENEIDLSRAVPNITFGEFVNVIRNWFNYDLIVEGRRVTMNKIKSVDPTRTKDFTFAEIPEPKRNLLSHKSFVLKLADLDDDYKKDSIYYDSSGPLINGVAKEETSVIEINGYHLPIAAPKIAGYNTANVLSESENLVQLVGYEGLQNGQNNAIFNSQLDFPGLFYSHWEPWLKRRLVGNEYQWSKVVSIADISRFRIKDEIFCYNNIHIIKEWEKEKLSENSYLVNITTETTF